MRLQDYWFDLPEESIAQEPLADREASRMLVVNRAAGGFHDERFANIANYIREGDVVVLNDTRVFPARLLGESETGANVEIFLVRRESDADPYVWRTLARPARRLRPGKRVDFGGELAAEVLEKFEDGTVLVRFECEGDFDETIDRVGRTPLPPYIRRSRAQADTDRERYQTVYAHNRGSIAAPTAGLHFTPQKIAEVEAAGATIARVTLHVGYGTFEPVRETEDLSRHRVMAEEVSISPETADVLNRAKSDKRRIVAIGTTTTRALEGNIAKHDGRFAAERGETDLTITPGYRFRAIDALLTNFHLPESSLLILVSTFAGRELIMRSYRHAVEAGYRFYSYGDCMFVV
ncbi:MAG: tRNA preQ1(34) S-adenosylmethionine ribosyltransferase-isomerase QueA [Pyrinomonadaceae bacterium]